MAHTKTSAVWLHLTPERKKLTGSDLSSIRSHNAHRHRKKRKQRKCPARSTCEHSTRNTAGRARRDSRSQAREKDNILQLLRRPSGDGIRSDPFDSFPVPANKQVSLAIDHYATVLGELYGPYLSGGGVQNGCTEVLLPEAIQHHYFFHTIVAVSRTIQLMSKGCSATHDTAVIYHRGQALLGIGAALSDEYDDALPLAVMTLVTLDWRLGFDEAVQEHNRGLRRILRLRGKTQPSKTSSVIDMLMRAAKNSGLIEDEGKSARDSILPEFTPAYTPELRSFLSDRDHPCSDQLQPPSLEKYSPLPVGFRNLQTGDKIFSPASHLLRKVNEVVENQLRRYRTSEKTERIDDEAWQQVESQPYELALLAHRDLIEGWLCWGTLAFIYQSYSRKYRREIVPGLFTRVDKLIHQSSSVTRSETKKHFNTFAEHLRITHRRNCAVWVLMCLAAAILRRREDEDEVLSLRGLSAPIENASDALLERIRCLLDFDKIGVNDVEKEWGTVKSVVIRFWCPPWIVKDWEAMWKQQTQPEANNPLHHHWHNIITPEDVYD